MTRPGILVSLDGPGGAGKSTLARIATEQLRAEELPVLVTAEPSAAPIGELARSQTHAFTGYALACLVAADRYHHLDTEIRPALRAGRIVICDRYVPSSYVFQVLDGVDHAFISSVNAYADLPDLAVILTGQPAALRRRLTARGGSHGRFEDDPAISSAEVLQYQDVARMLAADGIRTLVLDSTHSSAGILAERLVTAIKGLWSASPH